MLPLREPRWNFVKIFVRKSYQKLKKVLSMLTWFNRIEYTIVRDKQLTANQPPHDDIGHCYTYVPRRNVMLRFTVLKLLTTMLLYLQVLEQSRECIHNISLSNNMSRTVTSTTFCTIQYLINITALTRLLSHLRQWRSLYILQYQNVCIYNITVHDVA